MSSALVERCVFAFGRSFGVIACSPGSQASLICCDIFGNELGDWTGCAAQQLGVNGNFSADPLFCDIATRDLRVASCSPCVPGYHPDGYDCGGMVGALGIGCECGQPTEPTSWGAIKSLYK